MTFLFGPRPWVYYTVQHGIRVRGAVVVMSDSDESLARAADVQIGAESPTAAELGLKMMNDSLKWMRANTGQGSHVPYIDLPTLPGGRHNTWTVWQPWTPTVINPSRRGRHHLSHGWKLILTTDDGNRWHKFRINLKGGAFHG